MNDTAALKALLERVKSAAGPDRMLDRLIDLDLDAGNTWDTAPPYTASLDASLALLERVLPGSTYRIEKHSAVMMEASGGAPFWASCGAPGEHECATGSTNSLALIAAMLEALTALISESPHD